MNEIDNLFNIPSLMNEINNILKNEFNLLLYKNMLRLFLIFLCVFTYRYMIRSVQLLFCMTKKL